VVAAVRAQHPEKRLEVWFQDESRFGQQGTISRIWGERGSRPRRALQTEYKWIYLFGAVCPESGQSVGYLLPTANTECMNIHLEEISRNIREDAHVVLLMDRAGWHLSGDLKVPANITPVPLPPYSPELNSIELAWLYIKSRYLSNRVYEDHDALLDAGETAWNRFARDKDLVKSLCNSNWVLSALSN